MSVTPAYSASPARPTDTTVVNFLFSLINEDYATGNGEVVPQAYSFAALYYSWGAAQEVTFAIEFLFLSAAQLMVLDRMSDFVTSQALRGTVHGSGGLLGGEPLWLLLFYATL